MDNVGVDIGLYLAYAMTAFATLAFFGAEIFYMVKHIEDAKGTLLGIGALVLICVVGYVIGVAITPDQATIATMKKVGNITEGTMAFVNGGLVASYILLAIAAIAMFADMAMGLTKK